MLLNVKHVTKCPVGHLMKFRRIFGIRNVCAPPARCVRTHVPLSIMQISAKRERATEGAISEISKDVSANSPVKTPSWGVSQREFVKHMLSRQERISWPIVDFCLLNCRNISVVVKVASFRYPLPQCSRQNTGSSLTFFIVYLVSNGN